MLLTGEGEARAQVANCDLFVVSLWSPSFMDVCASNSRLWTAPGCVPSLVSLDLLVHQLASQLQEVVYFALLQPESWQGVVEQGCQFVVQGLAPLHHRVQALMFKRGFELFVPSAVQDRFFVVQWLAPSQYCYRL